MRHFLIVVGVLCSFLGGVSASAQSPQTQPLLTPSSLTYLGSFRVPASDGTCKFDISPGLGQSGCLIYGGDAIGIGPVVNGQPTMYFGGHDWADQLCQVTIPAIGGTAQMVGKCQTINNLSQIDGNQGYELGGTLYFNGRLLLTATSYYPGGDTAKNTHFVSSNGQPAGLNSAPAVRVGTIKAGSVAGYMTRIPLAWRALLGGSALAGQCCRQIISRTSYGPALGAFNPDEVGVKNPAPLVELVNYPDEARALAPYSSGSPSELFTGATEIGGIAFPVGTRSILVIGRHGLERCYGFGTSNQALHRTPHPAGEFWCYDPFASDKGDHAYPYRHQIWHYDANDLALVKEGKLKPWEVKPEIWVLPGLPSSANNNASIRGATYDDTTRRLYVTEYTGGSDPRVHVYQVAGASTPPPPPPVDCVVSEPAFVEALSEWTPAVCAAPPNNEQSRNELWRRTVITPASNGGTCNVVLDEVRVATQACVATPPVEFYPGVVVDVVPTTTGYVVFVLIDGYTRPYMLTSDIQNPPKKGDRVHMSLFRQP